MNNFPNIQTSTNDESTSRIENINTSLNSSSSMKSLDSYIKLLTENKTIEDNTTQAITSHNEKAAIINPTQATPIISTKHNKLLLNPYISESIKSKMNAIITDNNIPNSTFNKYQSYRKDKTHFGRTHSIVIPALTNYSSVYGSMVYGPSCNQNGNGKESSLRKVIQMRQKLEKTLDALPNGQMISMQKTNYINYPISNIKRIKTGGVVSLKKRFYEETRKEMDFFQKGLETYTPRKVNSFNAIPRCDNSKKNYKLLRSQVLSSRMFM